MTCLASHCVRWRRSPRSEPGRPRCSSSCRCSGVRSVIDDQRVDGSNSHRNARACRPILVWSATHHHLVGTAHHLPLGFDQQQVAVEQPLGRDAADAQDRLLDVDVLHHPHRQRPQGDAGAWDRRSRRASPGRSRGCWRTGWRWAGCWSRSATAGRPAAGPPPASSCRRRAGRRRRRGSAPPQPGRCRRLAATCVLARASRAGRA